MEISDKRRRRLEDIANGINDSRNSGDGLSKILLVLKYIPAVYYGALLKQEDQERFADGISWKPKTLTTVNAIVLGLGTSAAHYFVGNEIMDFIRDLDVVGHTWDYLDVVGDIENYIIPKIANLGRSFLSLNNFFSLSGVWFWYVKCPAGGDLL